MTLTALPRFACKFGGTSLADSGQIRKVQHIIESDPRRQAIVVSAPGRRTADDKKITDLLYLCHHTAHEGVDLSSVFGLIRRRYEAIGQELGIAGCEDWLDEVEEGIRDGKPRDWVASRGEWLQARIIASYLGARFVDAADCVRFDGEGRLEPGTYPLTAAAVGATGMCVIPGFYGLDANGEVRTFSRGGSDITGAIVARAIQAGAYENWTDVDGFLMADPRVVEHARPIEHVTYYELRELSYMGATVLHEEAVFPVRQAGIPINIRNTNAPDRPGTWIVPNRADTENPIVGIAGRRGFSSIYLEKEMMNQERGFGRKVLGILETHGISYEHAPSSIDTMSVLISDDELRGKEESVLHALQRLLEPDRLEIQPGLALIATVGQGMSHRVGVASRLFDALARANVNIRMINQGSSEISIIVGVASADYEAAVQAIYNAFVPGSTVRDIGEVEGS